MNIVYPGKIAKNMGYWGLQVQVSANHQLCFLIGRQCWAVGQGSLSSDLWSSREPASGWTCNLESIAVLGSISPIVSPRSICFPLLNLLFFYLQHVVQLVEFCRLGPPESWLYCCFCCFWLLFWSFNWFDLVCSLNINCPGTLSMASFCSTPWNLCRPSRNFGWGDGVGIWWFTSCYGGWRGNWLAGFSSDSQTGRHWHQGGLAIPHWGWEVAKALPESS